jgi:hypothetical protein
MSAVAKNGTPSLATLTPGPECWVGSNLVAGEDLGAWDACYIKGADGKVYKSTGAAANAAAKVRGYAAKPTSSGQPVTLMKDVDVQYGSGLTPGADYYLSGTTAGGLDTAPSTGGTASIAFAIDATRIRLLASRY